MNVTKPNRKKHSYIQHLNAPPSVVFPLLCPVAEIKWAPGWNPESVISNSGIVEKDCVFITPPEFPSEAHNAIWIVTHYDSENFSLIMYKVVPEHTTSKLEITLKGHSNGSTHANVSYEITSIASQGDIFLEECTPEWYTTFMLDWEKALNYFLLNDEMIA